MGGADGYPRTGGMGRAPAMLALFSFRSFFLPLFPLGAKLA